MTGHELTIATPHGDVSGLLQLPDDAWGMLVLAHGAGAGMRHRFMADLAQRLAGQGVATLRYQFPYMEAHKPRTDPPDVAAAVVQAACEEGARRAGGVPIFAGGKSFGGRMTSTASSRGLINDVRGLVFVGFPLHPAKRPGIARADHLAQVTHPMLFLQGTRDDLADLALMTAVTIGLGARATLRVVEGANHAFDVLRSSGRSGAAVLEELAQETAGWMERQLATRA